MSEQFHCLKLLCAPPIHIPHCLQLLATSDLFTMAIVLPFPEHHIVGIIQYVFFSNWLLSPSNTLLRLSMSFHDLIAHFFSALNNIPLSGCTMIYLSIHLTEGNLCCFQAWAILNKATINICVWVFVWM